jgi:hypothetical protein
LVNGWKKTVLATSTWVHHKAPGFARDRGLFVFTFGYLNRDLMDNAKGLSQIFRIEEITFSGILEEWSYILEQRASWRF